MVRCPRPGCKGTLVASWDGTCSLCGRSLDSLPTPLPFLYRKHDAPRAIAPALETSHVLPRRVVSRGSGHRAHVLESEALVGDPPMYWEMACKMRLLPQDLMDAPDAKADCSLCTRATRVVGEPYSKPLVRIP